MPIRLPLAVTLLLSTIDPAALRSATYPQLISTQYDKGASLPERARRPAASLEVIDKAKLPSGAGVSGNCQIRERPDLDAHRQGPISFVGRGI